MVWSWWCCRLPVFASPRIEGMYIVIVVLIFISRHRLHYSYLVLKNVVRCLLFLNEFFGGACTAMPSSVTRMKQRGSRVVWRKVMLNSFAVLEKKTLWMHQIGGIDFYNIANRVVPIRPTADKNKLGKYERKKNLFTFTLYSTCQEFFSCTLSPSLSLSFLSGCTVICPTIYTPIWGLESDLAMGEDGWLESQHCIFVYFNVGLPY